MALIRYPGSKAKIAAEIEHSFPDEMCFDLHANASRWEYREPFFGAGAVGFKVLPRLHPDSAVWLNDIDPGMAALWRSVWQSPKDLCQKIAAFTPSAERFYEFKQQDGEASVPDVERGFRKLALHQMSVSGFGAKSGGPLGGRDQENALYKVDCRWNPQRLMLGVATCHRILSDFRQVRITCGDFSELLKDAPPECFIYLDPPYVVKGDQLYKHSMTEADHRRLAKCLERANCSWALSYDDAPLVRELYRWADIREVHITYTNATHAKGSRPKNREVVITPPQAKGT